MFINIRFTGVISHSLIYIYWCNKPFTNHLYSLEGIRLSAFTFAEIYPMLNSNPGTLFLCLSVVLQSLLLFCIIKHSPTGDLGGSKFVVNFDNSDCP